MMPAILMAPLAPSQRPRCCLHLRLGPVSLGVLLAACSPTGPAAISSSSSTGAAPHTAAPPTTASLLSTTITSVTEPVCLFRYTTPQPLLAMRDQAEPFLTAGDFDGDGDPDIVVTRLHFQTNDVFPLEMYLHEGDHLVEATADLFAGIIPTVQHPAETVVADFNSDGVDDVFVADTGRDLHPFPGYQNALALSAPGGGMVDGTPGLPQQRDYSHSAEAADVDDDGDLDLYVGNVWGGEAGGVGPQIWLNDGTGRFTVAPDRLPAVIADRDFGAYLTEAFADLDGDGDLDLVLGDAGDNLDRGPASEVLLNDGTGRFAILPGAMPPTQSPSNLVHDIAVTDLDSDGYPDLIVVAERAGSGGSYLQVLHNLGNGRFENVTGERLSQLARRVWIRRLDLIDLDHDGDPDLLGRPWDDRDPDPILWLNDGGRFTLTPCDFGLSYLYYDFLDWDGDGGHDLVSAGFSLLRQQPCG